MQVNKVWAVYFSPTGGTEKVVKTIAETMAAKFGLDVNEIDLTKPENRKKTYEFGGEDLAVVGTPVYAGRIPNKILPDLEACLAGSGTKAVPVSVFGNRSFDDGLMELKLLLEARGFVPVAAAAAVSQHAFSETLAAGRPDEKDLEELRAFAERTAEKVMAGETFEAVSVRGNNPVGPYYTPLTEEGTPAKFLKAKPLTDMELCDHCGICAQVCPVESIDAEDESQVPGICIKCQACVKKCPKHAKYFTDEQFLSHVRMIEKNYSARSENSFFEN